MTANRAGDLHQSLRAIAARASRPEPWTGGGNLPWNDPAFSRRMLREHLDQSHSAASRTDGERALQIPWLREKLGLQPGHAVLDLTCGPGLYAVDLARNGCEVTGVDFAPAAIEHARELAKREGVASRCTFIEADVLQVTLQRSSFDAALMLYGQLAVFPAPNARALVTAAGRALRPGGVLGIELRDPAAIDRREQARWYTAASGLWSDSPHLVLAERFWHQDDATSTERYHVLDIDTGSLEVVQVSDRAWQPDELVDLLRHAGFAAVETFGGWDGLALPDAERWNVYIARK